MSLCVKCHRFIAEPKKRFWCVDNDTSPTVGPYHYGCLPVGVFLVSPPYNMPQSDAALLDQAKRFAAGCVPGSEWAQRWIEAMEEISRLRHQLSELRGNRRDLLSAWMDSGKVDG